MTQLVINVGTAPNDGLGDPIRTAYQKCNSNFSELYSRVQTSVPPTLVGSVGDTAGMYAYDSNYFYYCYADYDGSSTIWGKVADSVADYGNANVVTLLAAYGSNTVSTTGTITAGNITGGNLLTAGLISATANITGGNLRTAGLITATGNVTGGNILTAGLVTATGNVQAGNLRTAGLITATGNITGGNVTTAGLITATGNVQAGNLRTAGLVSATGNVTGNNISSVTTMQLAVYANTTVRDSSISSPQPGMMIYVTGTGMQVRGATSWNTVAGTGT